jgi:hypothetical protein
MPYKTSIKDQSEATNLATNAKSTRLMKGMTMNRANCPDHAPTHIIEMPEASPKSPNSEPGGPTGPADPERAPSHTPEVAASIFLELIFIIGIHASNMPDLSSTPPWC